MHLFSPLTLRGITLRNRIAVSPMCQYSSQDGFATDWHLVHLGSRAVGGAGLVMAEASAVTPEGRISPGDLGIWKEDHVDPLARVTRFVKSQGASPGIQLAHAGRKASTAVPWRGGLPLGPDDGGWAPIHAPSAIPFSESHQTPAALSASEILDVVKAFARAAGFALAAGFEVVELHGAHGYLINEFLSPLGNRRTDAYGGSRENRMRLLIEIVEAVRRSWPERLPLLLRISASDWAEEGWSLEDSVALAQVVQKLGVDLIDCSSGGMVGHAKVPVGPGYQVPFAREIRRLAGVATGAVGMLTEPMQADQIIRNGEADLVFLARQHLRDPYWALHAAQALHHDFQWPEQYERAKPAR